MSARILIVDDDLVSRNLLAEVVAKVGHPVALAGSGEEALRLLRDGDYPIVLSDIRMLEVSGLEVLKEVKRRRPQSVVVLMTGFGSMEGALEALKEGAFDYISKPFKMDDLKAILARALKHWESQNSAPEAAAERSADFGTSSLIGKSPKIVEVYKTLARAALSSHNVLISGEPGTGKELVAKSIHAHSPRREKKLVKIAADEFELLDERLAEAVGGALLIEGVGTLSAAQQLKLLRAMEESEPKDIRFLGMTQMPLKELEDESQFRRELYYKLGVISIELPALRVRMEDLPELVGFFLAKHSARNHKRISHLSREAMELLQSHAWPGNVRELEHTVERAVALSSASVLEPEDFRELKVQRGGEAEGALQIVQGSLEDMEKAHILKVLEEAGYNKSRASEILGIDRATLYRKAKLYGIDLKGGKSG